MRHRVKGSKLSRKKAHRKQTLRDLSNALIREHRIVTTLAKAKALRPFFEPLVTRAKEDTQHNRRQVFSTLNNKHTVSKLFNEIGPEAQGRPGGYTRIVRYGYRKGDGAEMAIIELVDYNDIKPEQEQKKQKKTRRAGRKKKTTSAQTQDEQGASADEADEHAEEQETSAETATEDEVEQEAGQEAEADVADDQSAQEASEEETDDTPEENDAEKQSGTSTSEEESSSQSESDDEDSDEDKKQ